MKSDAAAPAGDACGSLPAFLSVDVRSAPPLEIVLYCTVLRPCRNKNQKDKRYRVTVEQQPIELEYLDTFSQRALNIGTRDGSDVAVPPPADGDGHWSFFSFREDTACVRCAFATFGVPTPIGHVFVS